MQSTAKNVSDYLKEVPDDRRSTIERLRKLCRKTLTGYEEVMEYGMPGYRKGNRLISFASQRNYISIYGLRKVLTDADQKALVGAGDGKGCLRFSKPEKIDFAVIERLLVAVRKQ
jgi:uncharacterized protein YdhG (YjbR/CyaY superfamily)